MNMQNLKKKFFILTFTLLASNFVHPNPETQEQPRLASLLGTQELSTREKFKNFFVEKLGIPFLAKTLYGELSERTKIFLNGLFLEATGKVLFNDVVEDGIHSLVASDSVNLGNSSSLCPAERIDSLKALPAALEILLPRFLTTFLAEAMPQLELRQLPFTQLSVPNLQKLSWQDFKDKLKDSPLFKADIFLTIKYLKFLGQEFVKRRICGLSNTRIYATLYKWTGGIFDEDWFSLAGSILSLEFLKSSVARNLMNANATDRNMLEKLLGEKNSAFLLKTEQDVPVAETAAPFLLSEVRERRNAVGNHNFLMTAPIPELTNITRTPKKAIARFFLEKVTARVIFFSLKAGSGLFTKRIKGSMQALRKQYFEDETAGNTFELNLYESSKEILPYCIKYTPKDGLQIFKVISDEHQTTTRLQEDTQEFFEKLADWINEPTLKIKSERKNVFLKWMADSIAHNMAAPVIENWLTAKNIGSDLLEHRNWDMLIFTAVLQGIGFFKSACGNIFRVWPQPISFIQNIFAGIGSLCAAGLSTTKPTLTFGTALGLLALEASFEPA